MRSDAALHSSANTDSFRSIDHSRAITTSSASGGHCDCHFRNTSRTNRLKRLRNTAQPTRRETTSPRRGRKGDCSLGSRLATTKTQCGVDTRTPLPMMSRYSERLRIRWSRPKRPCASAVATALLLVGSDGQAPTTTSAAILEYFLASAGLHALAVAMGAKTARIAGLKSTLRHDFWLFRKGRGFSHERGLSSSLEPRSVVFVSKILPILLPRWAFG